jgi:hypothetical protein
LAVAPFTLIETAPGMFSLLLRDLGATSGPFEAAGHAGNGYSWQALAQYMLESSLSDVVAGQVELDSGADMFCARSHDHEALTQLGELLADAASNPKRLTKLIAGVPASLWDD